jgi:branched-chain amino acid transport system substrate-binding protein
MGRNTRRVAAAMLGAGLFAIAGAQAQQPTSVKIGYAISKTGPNAGGANITQLPNFQLWVKEVNDKGGLMLSSVGRRLPIEVVEYDDRSNSEEAVRAVERLVEQDKVDLLLPPWGTGLNLAVGPVFNKYGYPQLAFTAVTDRAPDLAKRWPNSFWLLGTSAQYVDALVELLAGMRKDGKINENIAMIAVADGFGIDLSKAAREGFAKAGLKLVYDKSYPVGTQDLSPLIGEASRSGADSFIAFSYPPDTLALTDQAKIAAFSPKVMFLGVGVAFPLYAGRFGANSEGVMSLGGWSRDVKTTADYRDKHKAMHNRDPDYWASQVGYASLQMLQQAVERVGKIDRPAIIKDLQTGTFDTVLGSVKLQDNTLKDAFWLIGQWQGGVFTGVAPQRAGAAPVAVPKPAWK